jgi:hypothetical protein
LSHIKSREEALAVIARSDVTSIDRTPSLSVSQKLRAGPLVDAFFPFGVAQRRLATRVARENSIPVFRRWNYPCSELTLGPYECSSLFSAGSVN